MPRLVGAVAGLAPVALLPPVLRLPALLVAAALLPRARLVRVAQAPRRQARVAHVPAAVAVAVVPRCR